MRRRVSWRIASSRAGVLARADPPMEGVVLTMLSASVVLPEMAMFKPATQAQDLVDPVNFDFWAKTGPPPPAVLMHQPSRANAAMTAAIDLMKNSHRILRG